MGTGEGKSTATSRSRLSEDTVATRKTRYTAAREGTRRERKGDILAEMMAMSFAGDLWKSTTRWTRRS